MWFTNVNVVHVEAVSAELAEAERRTSRRDRRTEEILDHAMKVVEEVGFDALTLSRVAESLGYVTTAIYRYFPSKDALSAALQRRAIDEIHRHFASELAAARAAFVDATPQTAALAMLFVASETYLALPTTLPKAWHFVALLLGDPRPLLSDEEAAKTRTFMGRFLLDVDALFADAERTHAIDGAARHTKLLAFWAVLHGASCLEKTRRLAEGFPGAVEIGRVGARALLVGFGASPQRLSAAAHLAGRLHESSR